MTPIEELRAAAKQLGSLITFLGDNRGPWYVSVPEKGYPQSISNKGVPYCVADTHEDPSIPVFTIAPYIAAMHPGVGKALVKLLEDCAELHEAKLPGHRGQVPPGCQWCADEDFPCSDMRNVLAVAHQILAGVTA